LRLSTSPDFLQSVIDARWEWVARDGTPKGRLADVFDCCLCVESDSGGVVCTRHGDTLDAHLMFLPKARDVLGQCRDALRLLFLYANTITGAIASDNTAALRLVRRLGFTHTHTTPASFIRKGVAHNTLHFRLTREGWQKATEGLNHVRR
jgi:hypothetical protein